MDLDGQELARRCSQGDRLAEDELYRRYAARVYTLCRRYLGDDEEAKDLMQESLIQALEKIQTFDGSKGKRWRTVSLDRWAKDTIPEPTEAEMEAIPEEKLLEWIARLPDLRRAVFNLFCIDGYSHKEIGKMLGISEKGSAGVLAKARKQLKETITRYLNGQES